MPIRANEMHQDVIYPVPLSPCTKVYTGEKSCTLGKRLNEHKASVRNQCIERSGIVDHCLSCRSSRRPHFENTQLMRRETNSYKRKKSVSRYWEIRPTKLVSKIIEICNIWNKAFFNKVWGRTKPKKWIQDRKKPTPRENTATTPDVCITWYTQYGWLTRKQ